MQADISCNAKDLGLSLEDISLFLSPTPMHHKFIKEISDLWIPRIHSVCVKRQNPTSLPCIFWNLLHWCGLSMFSAVQTLCLQIPSSIVFQKHPLKTNWFFWEWAVPGLPFNVKLEECNFVFSRSVSCKTVLKTRTQTLVLRAGIRTGFYHLCIFLLVILLRISQNVEALKLWVFPTKPSQTQIPVKKHKHEWERQSVRLLLGKCSVLYFLKYSMPSPTWKKTWWNCTLWLKD